MAQSQRPYGTPPHRRTDAPGASPVELRRACVPTRLARSRAPAGTTGPRLGGRSRRALVAVPVSPTDPPAPDLHHAHDVMRGFPPRARATAAPRSPTPTAEGSTPSEPAPPRPHRRGTCSLTTADASSPGPRHGSRHTTPMRASPSTGTTRIHAVVAQPGQSTRLSSGESRVRISSSAPPRTPWVRDLSTWPNWRRHRATNPAVAGSSPAVDPTARAERFERPMIRCVGTGILPPSRTRRAWKSVSKPDGSSAGAAPLLDPPGSRIIDPVVVVQRRGPQHATLTMRVRLPPTTPPPARSAERGILRLKRG